MQFRIKPLTKNICFIYGFAKNERVYDFVLTLETKRNGEEAEVHAMLSRSSLTATDFIKLWDALKEASPVPYFLFEVFPEHAKAYKVGMEIAETKQKTTFDGWPSEVLKICRNAKIKFAFSKNASKSNPVKRLKKSLSKR